MRLKEDIRVYSDESMSRELLLIKSRRISGFAGTYDVIDSHSGLKVGALKRRGWKSLVKEEWILMDTRDNEIGRIQEDTSLLPSLRQFFIELVVRSYNYTLQNESVGTVKQPFNPFGPKYKVDISADAGARIRNAASGLAFWTSVPHGPDAAMPCARLEAARGESPLAPPRASTKSPKSRCPFAPEESAQHQGQKPGQHDHAHGGKAPP